MASVKKTVFVTHSATSMFALVDHIESYPDFLPWCAKATELSRVDGVVTAKIALAFKGIKSEFSTHNINLSNESIKMQLIEGPFKNFDGAWKFTPLTEHACKIDFELHYEFSSKFLEKIIGPVFHGISVTLVDAFVREADRRALV